MKATAHLPLGLLAWGALGVALHIGLARFAYGVVLPPLREELALGYTAAGVLNATHLAGYLVGTLLGPALARRMSMAQMARGAHLLVAGGALLCALAPAGVGWGVWLLSLGRLATGLGAGAAVIAIMVSVLSSVAEDWRARASVLMWTGMALAILGCGLSAPWLLQAGAWRWAFAAAAVLALVLAVALPIPSAAPANSAANSLRGAVAQAAGEHAFGLRSVATPRWLGLIVAYFCFGLGYIAYATFAGARMAAAAAPAAQVAVAWTTLALATLCGSAATWRLLGKPQWRALALPVAMALATVGSAVAALPSASAALWGAVLVGLGLAATPALVTAAARARSSAQDYARAFSITTAALGLGQLVGPVLAGALADGFGSAAAPGVAALAYGLGAVCATLDLRWAARQDASWL